MYGHLKDHLTTELSAIRSSGLWKSERIITSPQGPEITLDSGQSVLNFCANNYLGLSGDPEVVEAAQAALDGPRLRYVARCASSAARRTSTGSWSSGSPSSSGRRTRSSTPRASTPTAACSSRCSGEDDAIITDALNHASIIDGVRLCKAKRFVYEHNGHGRPGGEAAAGAPARASG